MYRVVLIICFLGPADYGLLGNLWTEGKFNSLIRLTVRFRVLGLGFRLLDIIGGVDGSSTTVVCCLAKVWVRFPASDR